jgi:hypothetical protein
MVSKSSFEFGALSDFSPSGVCGLNSSFFTGGVGGVCGLIGGGLIGGGLIGGGLIDGLLGTNLPSASRFGGLIDGLLGINVFSFSSFSGSLIFIWIYSI